MLSKQQVKAYNSIFANIVNSYEIGFNYLAGASKHVNLGSDSGHVFSYSNDDGIYTVCISKTPVSYVVSIYDVCRKTFVINVTYNVLRKTYYVTPGQHCTLMLHKSILMAMKLIEDYDNMF